MPILPKWCLLVLAIISSIAQLLLWLPISLYRSFVIIFVKAFHPNFGKILDLHTCLFNEKYWEDPTNWSIVLTLQLEGNLGILQLRDIFNKNVLNAKILSGENSVVDRYPELKQFQADLLGYRFWKQDENFRIENHIYENWDTLLDLDMIHEKVMNRTFPQGRSPWELILFSKMSSGDDGGSCCCLAFRIHHSMGDAYSVLKLLVECLGETKLRTAEAVHVKQNLWQDLLYYFLLPINTARAVYSFYAAKVDTNQSSFRVRNFSGDKSPLLVAFSREIPLKELKAVAKANQVRTAPVIMSIMTGGIVAFNGHSEKGSCYLPTACSLPLPGHPPSLTNHHLLGVMELPIGFEFGGTPWSRLRECDKIYSNLRRSDLPRVIIESAKFVESFGNVGLRQLFFHDFFSVAFSNVAGAEEGFSIAGRPCTDFRWSAGIRRSSVGVKIIAFTYRGMIRFAVVAKGSVLTKGEAQKLSGLMESEFEVLKQASFKQTQIPQQL